MSSHNRSVFSAAWALLAALLALVGSARADIKTGDAFPALAANGVVNLAGGEVPVMEGKLVLVDFWASWCAPCKASFPMMAKLQKDYAERGLVIAAVGIDEKPAAATAFWKKMAPTFPTLHDRTQALVQKVGVPTMPTSYLVGRDGRVRFIHSGFHGDVTERELRKQIDSLLAEKN
ncbi:MAG: TlpA disulfide reductase family protein [Verrucomicrobiota bacterium]